MPIFNKICCGFSKRIISYVTAGVLISAASIMPALAGNGSVVYTYDALGRVTTASYDTGVLVIYSYDANGNRLSQTVNVNTASLIWNTGNWDQALWN